MRWFLHAKIHKATVTQADVDYVGSITIDRELCEKCGLLEGEKVLVTSNTSGGRLETYVIYGDAGSGIIQMNGAAAHIIHAGEEIIIMGFELAEKTIKAKVILVDRQNRFVEYL
jgi:aspartate 1-decarboxylase